MSAANNKRATAVGNSTRRKPARHQAPAKPALRQPQVPGPQLRKPATGNRASSRLALTIGNEVPDFSLPATGGGPWRLASARGRKLVLYFYPRDNTPGCTLEGQQFAALAGRVQRAGPTGVGI
jgi:hypothetical protein